MPQPAVPTPIQQRVRRVTEEVTERLREQGIIAEIVLPEVLDTRIRVIDLIIAARALGEFRVVAAGCDWATLSLDSDQRRRLTEAHVAWQLD